MNALEGKLDEATENLEGLQGEQRSLKKELNKHEVGETVEIVVVREGREKKVNVYLSEYKGE